MLTLSCIDGFVYHRFIYEYSSDDDDAIDSLMLPSVGLSGGPRIFFQKNCFSRSIIVDLLKYLSRLTFLNQPLTL